MPVAHFPSLGGGGGPGAGPSLSVISPFPLDPAPVTPILKNYLVGIGDIGGSPHIILCSSQVGFLPEQFLGIMDIPLAGGGSTVITGRGSLFVPVVEGGGLLTPDTEIYLSATPGEVTHTAPSVVGETIVRVGWAVSTTQAILSTDFRQEIL